MIMIFAYNALTTYLLMQLLNVLLFHFICIVQFSFKRVMINFPERMKKRFEFKFDFQSFISPNEKVLRYRLDFLVKV